MRKFSRISAILLASVMLSSTAQATDAGFSLPFSHYSVYIRSNGVTEIRVKGSIAVSADHLPNIVDGPTLPLLIGDLPAITLPLPAPISGC